MEEAHATGAAQLGAAASAGDRAATGCASCLEEAWHWGFDLEAWRAHLGPFTWPEVLRQWAVAAGAFSEKNSNDSELKLKKMLKILKIINKKVLKTFLKHFLDKS